MQSISGKYDEISKHVLHATHAQIAMVVVLGGNKGHGFSICSTGIIPPEVIAELLENVAQKIRAQENV